MKKLALVLMTAFCLSVVFPILDSTPGDAVPGGGGGGDKCAYNMIEKC